jgi:hypothetical protein
LERWRTLEVAAHTLERWRALLLQSFVSTHVYMWGEVAALSLTLGNFLLTSGAPSFEMPCALLIGDFTQMIINKRSLSL